MRTIFHCDINNCFASIEMARDPRLRGRALAVCGDPALRRGIVLAKSEEAKKCGISTGESLWMARQKCPELLCIAPHFSLYWAYSEEIRRYYERYTPYVEPFGIDECWLDVTDNVRHGESAQNLAERIRSDMKRIFEVTVSIGVSFNKVFAKLGSDLKKPDAVTYLPKESMKTRIWPLPVSSLLDVGRSTMRRMRMLGIRQIGDLACADRQFIGKVFGKCGDRLWRWANGYDDSPVSDSQSIRVRKSLGHGTTIPYDVSDLAALRPWILSLSERIALELQREHLSGHGIQICIRDAELEFHRYRENRGERYDSSDSIARAALRMISQKYYWELPVHGIGIRIDDLFEACAPTQKSLFDSTGNESAARQKALALDSAISLVKERFGEQAIIRGCDYNATPQPSTFPSSWRGGLKRG